MKSLALAAGVVTILAGAAAPATAEPFSSFVDMCLTTDANHEAAAAAAKRAHWYQMPGEVFDEVPELQDAALYLSFDPTGTAGPPIDGAFEVMVTGSADSEGAIEMEGMSLGLCGVMSPGMDVEATRRQVAARLGAQPTTTAEGETIWLYSRKNGQLVSEAALTDAKDETILEAVRHRDLYVVFLLDEEGTTGLMAGAIRARP
ncbi:hypothetical protein BH09PSE1_BH09PSE1_03410 [soil metagenome]